MELYRGEKQPMHECCTIGDTNHVSNSIDRVCEAARKDKSIRFTALIHHITLDLLWASFNALNKAAAPGVDDVTQAGL
jgi:hypothetical protein